MTRTSRSEWKRVVRRWKRSGLEAREFAAREGVKPKTLWWWSWRLTRDQGRATKPVPPAFVEVGAPPEPVFAQRSAAAPIELVVREQVRVLVPDGFEADTLRRVLSVVEGR